jgi:hypothetical protein
VRGGEVRWMKREEGGGRREEEEPMISFLRVDA